MKSPNRATESLNKLLDCQKKDPSCFDDAKKLQVRKSYLKRSRSSMGSVMDMCSLVEASQQIESSIAFPPIELTTFDSDDDVGELYVPRTKRPCSGLVRCKKAFGDLSQLASTRAGSSGSLC